jgi:hypothetical protein
VQGISAIKRLLKVCVNTVHVSDSRRVLSAKGRQLIHQKTCHVFRKHWHTVTEGLQNAFLTVLRTIIINTQNCSNMCEIVSIRNSKTPVSCWRNKSEWVVLVVILCVLKKGSAILKVVWLTDKDNFHVICYVNHEYVRSWGQTPRMGYWRHPTASKSARVLQCFGS